MRTIAQFPTAQHAASDWWGDGARIDAIGFTPQGEPLLAYPEKLTIPCKVWVTERGFAVDDWIFFGWSLSLDDNAERLNAWMDEWAEKSDDASRIVNEMVEELNIRTGQAGHEAGTRGARVFLIDPRPDVHIPKADGGYEQELFDFD
jgi:hypothetical protein